MVGKSDYWALKLAPEDCIPQPLYTDFDHDTYGTNDGVTYWNACVGTSYASLFTTDCNDNNDLINPGQIDICDGFDNNCSGDLDEDIVDCNPGPGIEFQNTIGGYRDDYLQTIANTSDGGYILGGYSFSGISADKTETNWDAAGNYADYWVVKQMPH